MPRRKQVKNHKYTSSQRQFVRRIMDLRWAKVLSRRSYLRLDKKLGTNISPTQRKIAKRWREKARIKYIEHDIKIKSLEQQCVEMGIPYRRKTL